MWERSKRRSSVSDKETEKKPEAQADGWGIGRYPYPKGDAFIECDEMKCVGCGICQMACSMKHFGVINKDLSRIQVRKYLLPLPKAVQVTCVNCPDQERECEKACPLGPPAIYYDNKLLHLVIDSERCTACLQCVDACSSKAIRVYPAKSPNPFVCDLCDTENTGKRDPQCVDVCPCGALSFVVSTDARFFYSVQDATRLSADEKAELIAWRLYPLTKKSMAYPGWR
jgi:Fe-S-cluster-containing hydrogenase component 2